MIDQESCQQWVRVESLIFQAHGFLKQWGTVAKILSVLLRGVAVVHRLAWRGESPGLKKGEKETLVHTKAVRLDQVFSSASVRIECGDFPLGKGGGGFLGVILHTH